MYADSTVTKNLEAQCKPSSYTPPVTPITPDNLSVEKPQASKGLQE